MTIIYYNYIYFNPLPPHGGRPQRTGNQHQTSYFNPLPPHGGRPSPGGGLVNGNSFQSTPSAWRETRCFQNILLMFTFQSTPSAWRETNTTGIPLSRLSISIHSLRMEGDFLYRFSGRVLPDFNPLPPHGGRHDIFQCFSLDFTFQSTPSAWRETFAGFFKMADSAFQSTPSAWRETVSIFNFNNSGRHFNPLPPHGGRRSNYCPWITGLVFQSTPSAWRETDLDRIEGICTQYFNPLPPHGGRRCPGRKKGGKSQYFNPLPPHGGRHNIRIIFAMLRNFNPLPPHGGRPEQKTMYLCDAAFQSTPSAWRETICLQNIHCLWLHFNPLPPHGGRRVTSTLNHLENLSISIHSLRMEGDLTLRQPIPINPTISIHSLRMEGDVNIL